MMLCHRRPDRSFFWKGKQFPLCARCTGIHLGYIVFPFFLFNLFVLNIWITIGIILPTLIDGFTQKYFERESTNWLRVTTGVMAGVGICSLCAIIGKSIGQELLSLIKNS